MAQSNIATKDDNKTVVNNESLKGELLYDTTTMLTIFKGELKNSKVKLNWFKNLTSANCFSNYKNLTTEIVNTGESDLIRIYYNYINNLNSDIKNGKIKLACFPHSGKFNLKAIDSTKFEGTTRTKVNNIDLNSLAVTEHTANSVEAMAAIKKEEEILEGKKKDVSIVHDDSQKASYMAVIGLIANLSPSDRVNVLDELLSGYNIVLSATQGKHKKDTFDKQTKAAKAKKEVDSVTLLTK